MKTNYIKILLEVEILIMVSNKLQHYLSNVFNIHLTGLNARLHTVLYILTGDT